jgi:hypothetical protein
MSGVVGQVMIDRQPNCTALGPGRQALPPHPPAPASLGGGFTAQVPTRPAARCWVACSLQYWAPREPLHRVDPLVDLLYSMLLPC